MLSDLFSFLHNNPPYMGQEDSEALIDAVVYTMMVDKVIDPDEMEKVEDFILLEGTPYGGADQDGYYLQQETDDLLVTNLIPPY